MSSLVGVSRSGETAEEGWDEVELEKDDSSFVDSIGTNISPVIDLR
jgi:hypothetical protein